MNPQTTLTSQQITAIFQKHGLAKSPHITRIVTGFTNEVYRVDDYILKVCVKETNEAAFQKEAFLYQLLRDKTLVPQVVAFDESCALLDKPYMIYKRLPGNPAASHWHEMNDGQRKCLVHDLCVQLKIIDNTPIESYREQLHVAPDFSWQDDMCNKLAEKLVIIKEKKLLPEAIITQIEQFIETNKHALAKQYLGLVFWDIHFDNVLVDANFKLSGIIDLESTDYYSIDYRLMVPYIIERYPQLYLSEAMEQHAKREDYAHLLEWYKEFYPELFDFPDIETRLEFYDLLDVLSKLPEWPKAKNLHERLTNILA